MFLCSNECIYTFVLQLQETTLTAVQMMAEASDAVSCIERHLPTATLNMCYIAACQMTATEEIKIF